jgi:hypothetical protein
MQKRARVYTLFRLGGGKGRFSKKVLIDLEHQNVAHPEKNYSVVGISLTYHNATRDSCCNIFAFFIIVLAFLTENRRESQKDPGKMK